jgi:anti-sigma factor ChrR (cupin superfamily)
VDRALGELHRRHTVADLTRRRFVKNTAGTVAGMTAIGALVAEDAEARESVAGADPVVAYVSDPGKGEISLMSGDREVVVRDRKLAAQIVRKAG